MTGGSSEGLPLPETRHLDRQTQWRLLGQLVLGLLTIAVLGWCAELFLTPQPPGEIPRPPDSFRPTPDQLAQLKFATTELGANADLIRASGSISADGNHSTPILLPFSGQVLDVLVEPGQKVTRGQPLLRVASPELVDARNALLTASAQQTSAVEAQRLAEGNLARQKAIYETAGGAQKDYLQAQADLITAQSNARTAASALRAARDRLSLYGKTVSDAGERDTSARVSTALVSTIYRAPVSGVIADRSVAAGQFLSAGGTSPLMTITDPVRVWLVAQLPESEAANVQLGDQVVVTTPALSGRQFTATIDNIAAGLDPVTHRLSVRATIANPDGALKPQMFASFAIRRAIGGGTGMLIPSGAVIHEGDATRVWVLGRDKLLYGRLVAIGETEGGFTRVTRGLHVGDRVVTQGALFVNEAGLDQ